MSIEKLPYDKEEEELVKRDVERDLYHTIKREQAREIRRVERYLNGEEDDSLLAFYNEEIGEAMDDDLDDFINEEELYERLVKIEEGYI